MSQQQLRRGAMKSEESAFRNGEGPSKEFLDLFEKLDVSTNGELIELAWKDYDTIGQQVILEGNQKAWMACAFYTTVWKSTPVGQEPVCKFSVSNLLKICNLSVLEFFEKLNKWAEMLRNPSRRLLDHINRVQSSLAVSTVVYKKFLPIFRRMFMNAPIPKGSPQRQSMGQTTTLAGASTGQIFEFSWTMFIAMKKQFANTGDDLMNCFHLLLCIVDQVFDDLRNAKQTRLLNAEFVKLVDAKDNIPLEVLCDIFDGVILDAKHFRTHWLVPRFRKLSDDGVISFGNIKAGGLLAEIGSNKAAFEKLYEDGMLRKAEVDERIFIENYNMDTVFNESFDGGAITLLRRSNLNSNWAIDADLLLRMSTQNCLEKLNSQRIVQTPLSVKSYVITPEQFCPTTPISISVQKAQKLTALLKVDFKNTDNDFDHLLAQCRENPKSFITERVSFLGERLNKKVEAERRANGVGFDESFSAMIKQRKEYVEALFYRLLQQVVMHDRERSQNNGMEAAGDLDTILHKADFIGSLWICALELVLFTYSSEREFPWSADLAGVAPVNFYKIIELVIRAEPELSREMVKHLNKVEEKVLEELAWAIDSTLWAALAKHSGEGVPSCRSVSLTPYDLRGGANASYNIQQGSSSLVSRYSNSPMKGFDRHKRPMDYEEEYENVAEEEMEGETAGASQPRAKRTKSDMKSGVQQMQALPSSISVFFRKVYYLAAVRLTDLCDRIRMDDPGRQKVWTLFEHLLRTETNMMAGRHLDQNLMCCLYIVSKVSCLETSFHDIMYNYRHQPQAASRVYRRVLIDPSVSPTVAALSDDGASRDSVSSISGGKLRSSSALPAPDMASAPPTPEPQNFDYADLIKYYNRVFVAKVEDFVKKLNPANPESKENALTLVAMPKVYCNSLSPRRLINEQINVLPLSPYPAVPGRPARYNLNRSPYKDLKSINAMVRGAPQAAHY